MMFSFQSTSANVRFYSLNEVQLSSSPRLWKLPRYQLNMTLPGRSFHIYNLEHIKHLDRRNWIDFSEGSARINKCKSLITAEEQWMRTARSDACVSLQIPSLLSQFTHDSFNEKVHTFRFSKRQAFQQCVIYKILY